MATDCTGWKMLGIIVQKTNFPGLFLNSKHSHFYFLPAYNQYKEPTPQTPIMSNGCTSEIFCQDSSHQPKLYVALHLGQPAGAWYSEQRNAALPDWQYASATSDWKRHPRVLLAASGIIKTRFTSSRGSKHLTSFFSPEVVHVPKGTLRIQKWRMCLFRHRNGSTP